MANSEYHDLQDSDMLMIYEVIYEKKALFLVHWRGKWGVSLASELHWKKLIARLKTSYENN
jgi:hypothetical protein